MRFRKRLCALLLALLMTLSLGGCSLSFPGLDSLLRNGGVKFSEMEYERPDMDAVNDCVDVIYDMLESGASYKDVVKQMDSFYGLYWSFYTMFTLADIRNDLDVNDEYYADEYAFCSEAEVGLSNTFNELMYTLADSDIADELDSRYFGGLLAENYSGEFEDGFETLNALYEREGELVMEYEELLPEFYDMYYDDEEDAYKTYNEEMCTIYIELVKTRNAIAQELGFDSYEECAYFDYGREYVPSDLDGYLAAIKEKLVPLYKTAEEAGIIDDAYNAAKSYSPVKSLGQVSSAAGRMDERLSDAMNFMLSGELYDVDASYDKAETSYVIYIDDYESPFLFVNSDGYQYDVLTIGHEFGHFCDSFTNFDMDSNLDTSETMSQGMEYMLLCYLDDAKLLDTLREYKMADALSLYADQACFNEFERRVFSLPEDELTVDRVNGIYAELATEYGFGDLFGDYIGYSWIDINHFFEYPFYVVSYCVSDSAAFTMYLMEQENAGSGLEAYLSVMDGAAEDGFLALLESAGMDSPITAESIDAIAAALKEVLGL